MKEIRVLLKTGLKEIKNRIFRRPDKEWGKFYLFTILGVGFIVGIYFLTHWVLVRLYGFEIIGPILMERLLSLVFLTFLLMLIFSNIITGLSVYYLSNDLSFLFSNPLNLKSIFASKFITTLCYSSWTILLFGLPVFIAYGVAMKAEWYFYPLIPFLSLPFLIIPAAIGIIIVVLLVRIYPAKRIKEITLILTLGFAACLILYFRFLQPERLVNPEGFTLLSEYLSFLKTPALPFLPSYWISLSFLGTIKANFSQALFYFLVLSSNAGMCYILAQWAGSKFYYTGWARSQAKVSGRPLKWTLLEKLSGKASEFKTLMLKDWRLFWRDVTQWSQVILFLAIAGIYLFNLKSFRLQTPSATLISFINLGFTGFVIAAIGIRFSFPSISLEGKAFWLLKSSPSDIKVFLKEKFWISFLPMLILAQALIITSNLLLKTHPLMLCLGIIVVFFMTLSLTALAVGMGAQYPQFKAENPAEIGGTQGGILYMIYSLVYVGICIVLLDWPLLVFLLHPLRRGASIHLEIYISVIGFLLINFLVPYLSLKKGYTLLQSYQWE